MIRKPSAITGCPECVHFDNGAATLEMALPGLTSFGSAHAAVRADDGICALHARYVAASSNCSDGRRSTAVAPPAALTSERIPSAKCDP
jgi:hypothetical protein